MEKVKPDKKQKNTRICVCQNKLESTRCKTLVKQEERIIFQAFVSEQGISVTTFGKDCGDSLGPAEAI